MSVYRKTARDPTVNSEIWRDRTATVAADALQRIYLRLYADDALHQIGDIGLRVRDGATTVCLRV